MTVEAQPDEVAAPQRHVAVKRALLRHVADLRPRTGRLAAADRDGARRRREQAEQDADERRLAGAVRAEHRHELARVQVEAEVVPQEPRPEPERERARLDDRRCGRGHRSSARSSASACRSCHCWKVWPRRQRLADADHGDARRAGGGLDPGSDRRGGLAVVEQHAHAVAGHQARHLRRPPRATGRCRPRSPARRRPA